MTQHYFDVNDRIRAARLPAEISVKLTQLGLDLDPEFCYGNLATLIENTPADKILWIDMEQSPYVDVTLELYRRARMAHANVGICLQAYLYRTEKDLDTLIAMGAAIRLVKGAYNEPAEIAYPEEEGRRRELSSSRAAPAESRSAARARSRRHRHSRSHVDREDQRLGCGSKHVPKNQLEFQMLYGIQRAEQLRLAQAGYRCAVLISYGSFWFPWFMRRLAERPANVLFLARNFFSN